MGLNRTQDQETMDSVVMGASMYAAFRHAMDGKGPNGQDLPVNWSEIDETVQEAWYTAARSGLALLDSAGDNEIQVTWKQFAKNVAESWMRFVQRGTLTKEFEQLDQAQRVAWEAACRHLGNLLALEPDEPLERHERHWSAWAKGKREALKDGSV